MCAQCTCCHSPGWLMSRQCTSLVTHHCRCECGDCMQGKQRAAVLHSTLGADVRRLPRVGSKASGETRKVSVDFDSTDAQQGRWGHHVWRVRVKIGRKNVQIAVRADVDTLAPQDFLSPQVLLCQLGQRALLPEAAHGVYPWVVDQAPDFGAVLGVLCQGLSDEVLGNLAQVDREQRFCQPDLLFKQVETCSTEWKHPHQHLVRQNTCCPQIHGE
mmetsp:Transcript_12040/g.21342  ORF Transcript_12040/g.21342 Transcript_12040/m.21342 type:complete len:215 (+) Transcript_12040:227-871(+)